MRILIRLGALVLVGAGCSSADAPMDATEAQHDSPPVVLIELGPDHLALGDTLQVIGSNLSGRDVRLALRGEFVAEDGVVTATDVELPLTVRNAGSATVRIDAIPFANGDQLGRFAGTARLVVAETTGPADTNEVAFSLELDPSLDVRVLRPSEHLECPPVVSGTMTGTSLALELRALGVGEAAPGRPLTFELAVEAPLLTAHYVAEDVIRSWPAFYDPSLEVSSPDGVHTIRFEVLRGRELRIVPGQEPVDASFQPPIRLANELRTRAHLVRLSTGSVEGVESRTATVVATVLVADGTQLRRVIPLEVAAPLSVGNHTGQTTVVERYAAQQVCGCVAGGDIGRELSYSEGESETRTRSLGFRWDVNVANSLGLTVGSFNPVIQATGSTTWSSTFGVDVSESLSSETHRGLNLAAQVLPGYFGVCYRQTERMERTTPLYYNDACGMRSYIGDAVLTDWGWGFDIATGPACPPPTNLPPPGKP